MAEFRRAFAVTLAVVALVLMTVFAFELINRNIAKSGFSSGEVFDFEMEEEVFHGEIMGRKFDFDISPMAETFSVLEKAVFLISPCSRYLRMLLIILT